jgi:hypothetical protein
MRMIGMDGKCLREKIGDKVQLVGDDFLLLM